MEYAESTARLERQMHQLLRDRLTYLTERVERLEMEIRVRDV
jgi:uncharacterized protein (UPF0335 family)